MEELQEILRIIFGDSINISAVCSIISVVLLPIITAFFNKVKTKLLKSESDNAIKDAQVKTLSNKLDNTEKCISLLSDMLVSTYLTSNTISDEQKKHLTTYASKIEKIAGVELSKTTEQLIDAVTSYVPDLNDKKKEILEVTDKAEEIIDNVNDATQAAVDKLKL